MGLPPNLEKPLLIGLLVDVSGSMLSSIRNPSGPSMNRLESFRDSLDQFVARGERLSQRDAVERAGPRAKLFAYGFGFGNPLSFLFGSGGDKVRDLLRLPGERISTIPIDSLSRRWITFRSHIEGMSTDMFGATPMAEAFGVAAERIHRELGEEAYADRPVLFILSDGEPTDASPSQIADVANELKGQGVLLISCYVTDEDLTEPRRLYASPSSAWPLGAQLMFECASVLPSNSPFEAYMKEYRWAIEPDARMFTQINQSDILSEFLNAALSPLDTGQGTNDGVVRVFISYSHQDSQYLKGNSLLGYLSGLDREGFSFWYDERILTSELWDERIRTEIERADIALVLVSQAFLNSRYCQIEVESFVRKRREAGLEIFPVIVSPCDWKSHDWLSATQARPTEGQTIERDFTTKGRRQELFLKIFEDLRALGAEIRSRRSGGPGR